MIVAPDVLGLIGNTPLVRLKRASEATGCEILGKAEFLNVGGSIKDRAALSIIRAARASGALKPGGTIVEGTAGNTGIGLAHVCRARGYKCVIYMPNVRPLLFLSRPSFIPEHCAESASHIADPEPGED